MKYVHTVCVCKQWEFNVNNVQIKNYTSLCEQHCSYQAVATQPTQCTYISHHMCMDNVVILHSWKTLRDKNWMTTSFQLFPNKFLRYVQAILKSITYYLCIILLLFEVCIFEDSSKSTKTSKFLSLKNIQLNGNNVCVRAGTNINF